MYILSYHTNTNIGSHDTIEEAVAFVANRTGRHTFMQFNDEGMFTRFYASYEVKCMVEKWKKENQHESR